ncbi:MAG: HAMP domain-containing sensor histidine kinase [Deltaproteobacteria bacterium]|nr:HAMP domain-containing sensor histidine kinase [Deltaproteobacteria bacterium]
MRFSIFSRLVIGYLTTFILVAAASAYAIVQLYRLTDITRSLQKTDNLIIDYEEKLTDALLSQIRYERKFIITKDNALYDQFRLFVRDFEKFLREARSIAESPQVLNLLIQVNEQHQLYQNLFNDEIKQLKSGQNYTRDRYRQKKEKATDEIIEGLKKIKAQSQHIISDKIERLDVLGTNTRRAAIVLTGTLLILGFLISFFTTRSITVPLSTLEKKTREIAKGDFRADLNLSSPPEMEELSKAFNLMCNKLNELDKMKSDFLSTMSHELRTPLTSIKEGTGLLMEGVGGAITDRQKMVLTILAEESNRLINLVNTLLDLSKMEAGMLAYNFEQANLAPLIEKVMIEIGPLAEAKKISLETKISKDLPMIKVDFERILQALRNLIGNAVKFTPEGGRVSVSARPMNGGLETSVADTGPGIPQDNLISIFEKFQQVDPTDSTGIKGTGLGLAIVKHIISFHGGRIWAESKPGQGSTFIFVLPF